MRVIPLILLLAVFVLAPDAHAQTANVQGVVDTLLAKYKSAGQAWTGTIENAATKFFWLLATISLGWTCISMAIKQSDLVEIVAELCRFIMFTGFFFWLLLGLMVGAIVKIPFCWTWFLSLRFRREAPAPRTD